MNDDDKPAKTTLEQLKAVAAARGYRIEVSPDGKEERMIRRDGTVAVIARRPSSEPGR
jgi:hypothetical protein